METEQVLHQQLPGAYRTLQPQAAQAIQHGQPHLGHHTLASQTGLDLTGLDDNDPVFHQDLRLQDPNGHAFFDRNHGHRPMQVQNNGSPHTPHQHAGTGQFGILTTGPIQHNSIGRLQQEEDIFGSPDGADQKSNGHLSSKVVVDPPNLDEWRQKLFNVDDVITLSEEEYVHTSGKDEKFTDLVCPDSKPTFLTSTTFTPIGRPNDTSASLLSLTIGTAASKDDHQEPQSPMIQTKRSASELHENETFAT
jgi:hypothetical protein